MSLLTTSITFAEPLSDELKYKAQVSIKEANIAIENFINNTDYLSQMKGAVIQHTYSLYDVDDTVIAYYFTIKKNDENIGFFITSARKNIDPLLEYGFGELEVAEFQLEEEFGNRIYYLGAQHFLYARNKVELEKHYEELKQKSLRQLHSIPLTEAEMLDLQSWIKNKKLTGIQQDNTESPGWRNLLNSPTAPNNSEINSTSKKVLPVDRIWQRRDGINNKNSACGPTTGAMIIDYYHDNLGYNVRDNDFYGSWANLVNHLRLEMDTYLWGTTMNNWREGLYNHVHHNGGSWDDFQFKGVGNSNFFITAINSDDPVGIRFDYFVENEEEINYHFVTGIGYNKNGSYTGDLHVAYKDPDGGKNNSGTKWLDWTEFDQDFTFAYLNKK